MSDEHTGNLTGSFGDKGTNVNQIAYGHPYADSIIEEAKKAIQEAPTSGPGLLSVMDTHKVPVHVIKGSGESGFSPDTRIIFIQTPGNAQTLTGEFLINLIKALREAAQEIGGFQAPDPRKDIIKYAEFIHSRNMESIIFTCKVVKELTNSSYFSDLLDSLTKLGLNNVYKAYVGGASKDELYEKYVETYNATNRGS